MPPTKILTSSLSGSHNIRSSLLRLTKTNVAVIGLPVKQVWHRIRGTRSADVYHNISSTPPSPATRLPQDIVEMVIIYLIYDKYSLLACSLTCHSWYIASIPHLHHTLVTSSCPFAYEPKTGWPKPLRGMHKSGLLPLVKRFQVREGAHPFSQELFDCSVIRHFWALTNVQELGIEYLDIPSFMPRIQRYFKNILPTVRSLSLRAPKGSDRQITYFIGLFQHLENLKLLHSHSGPQGESTDNTTPIPPFTPPLRGRLTVVGLWRTGLLEEMINLFGGIRFYYMEIYDEIAMQLLLDACANTLETLQLYPCGKELPPNRVQALADNFTAGSPRTFDLSRNKALRTLEIRARYLYDARLMTHALSTISSPVFSEVTVIYLNSDLSDCTSLEEVPRRHLRFKVFREMRSVRDFQLVLCAIDRTNVGKDSVEELKDIVEEEKVKMGGDAIFPEPLVIHSPSEFHRQFYREPLFSL